MMYIYGLCIACVNAVLAGLYVVYSMNIGCLGMFFNLLLAYPICLLIFTTPLFGGWAVTRIVRKVCNLFRFPSLHFTDARSSPACVGSRL